MTSAAIEVASKGLSLFDKFAGWLGKRDQIALEIRLQTVNAVHNAAAKTRQYTTLVGNSQLTDEECENWEAEISDLWIEAANKMAALDKDLSIEFYVKAYGWKRGGIFDIPEFDVIPRKVEEIYADTLKILETYEPVLKS